MANETTSSTLSELYVEIVAEALFVAQEASVMRNLVTNYNITGQGKEISVPIYAAVSAAAVAEATDLSNTAVNPTEATFTASEHGVKKYSIMDKKFGELLGNLYKTIRSQVLNVTQNIEQGLGKVQRLDIEETIICPRAPNYAIAQMIQSKLYGDIQKQ